MPGAGAAPSNKPSPGSHPVPVRFRLLRVPHPFPYQGSKRGIADRILPWFSSGMRRLIEPFCGSAAVSLAAASSGVARSFWLNDRNAPLVHLWEEILEHPDRLTRRYEQLWHRQEPDRKAFFFQVRERFNQTAEPHHLLYLLARIVKGSVRYSADGSFNQSADNRRSGMRPATMRRQIFGVSGLLAGRTRLSSLDYRAVTAAASSEDLVYLDPPYQGTSNSRDPRYCAGISRARLVETLFDLNARGVPFLLSYDGRTGNKRYGNELPASLSLRRIPIHAGVSTQSVLLGRPRETVESLYLSPALLGRLHTERGKGPLRARTAAPSLFGWRRPGSTTFGAASRISASGPGR